MRNERRRWLLAGIATGVLFGSGLSLWLRNKPEPSAASSSRTALELHRAGKYREAVMAYDAALATQDDSVLRTSLARALMHLGENDRALRELETAAQRSPQHAEIWHDLGLLRWKRFQDRAGAEQALTHAAELPSARPEVELDRGLLLLELDRPLDAAACLEVALARAPQSASWRAQAEQALVAAHLRRKELETPAPK